MWCGVADAADDKWVIAPCVLQTLGAVLLLPLSSWMVYRAGRRLCQAVDDRPRSQGRGPATPDGALILCAALAVLHVGWLVALCVPSPSLVPYQWFYHLAMVAVWLGVTGARAGGKIAGASPRVGIFAGLAGTVYLVVAAAWVMSKWGFWGDLVWEDWLALGAVLAGGALSFGLVTADKKRRSPTGEEQWLLAGTDEETGGKKERNWVELFITAAVYVWPDSWILKARAVVCLALIAVVRALNLLVPIAEKHLTNKLVEIIGKRKDGEEVSYGEAFYPWGLAFLVGLSIAGMPGIGMQGGVISTLRQTLFFPITQFAYRRISVDLFKHILDMDLTYHLHRKTGEVMRVMDRGTTAMQTVLSTILFNIGPQLVDMLIGTVYLAYKMNGFIGLVIIATLVSYLPVTIVMTEFRRKLRKVMNQKDNDMGFKVTDALLNYETVKYFNNDNYEVSNYAKSVEDYQKVELKMFLALQLMNVLQSLIMVSGVVGGVLLCIRGVVDGSLTVGAFSMLITLMQQLYAPLNFLGTYYRMIQNNATDMENMFELLDQQPTVRDTPGAQDLQVAGGEVEFCDVTFGYTPDNPVLRNLSFKVKSGQSLALVGATGSGKSSCLRLLFRFYDPQQGVIRIDGQAINEVTQASVHGAMSFVPQDVALFNNTILYNVRYGNVDATDEDCFRAAEEAAIHDRIATRFPQGYGTLVGERGLRLSGGEKQRVAIARAILKNSRVLLLDEATSALDSITEKQIQAALGAVRGKRTVLIVAHRLSTIMDVDTIVVLKNGKIAEQGSHPELVQQDGLYAEMWRKQQESVMDHVDSALSMGGSTEPGQGRPEN